MLTKDSLHGLPGKLRMVVLLAQMAEPYMAKLRRSIFGQQIGGLLIVQVPAVAADTLLEIRRVLPHQEHIDIVVRLQYQILCQANLLADSIGDMPDVGYETEPHTIRLNDIADTVAAVVRDIERRNAEVSNLQCRPFLDECLTIVRHIDLQATVARNALVYELRSIYGLAIITGNTPYRLDVVGMVMRDEHCLHVMLQADIAVLEMLLQGTDADTRIKQYGCLARL